MILLDSLDRQLISLLRADGRAPVSRLAEALKVSRATVQARLDRLIESGAILGFTVRAEERRAGEGVRAITLIEVSGASTSAVIRALRGLPEITALHTTNGAWDLVAEVHADSLADLDRILREMRTVEGVLNSETSILLRSVQ
ncbi:Lrp/AsnC family transcriptional regulator [Sphingomonas sp. HITSZ_GF]|uniref:Lrp/AsnC family transcriptional regulator n=1 Tax=Sphingomonas sp. HITSZ_GF TaxID=3037247 RepID=UPI00240D4F42|nr:Lrp/AsnC family transcriptional regulator [Sphingomonas sp. HITSZ_GF]MDG2534169.1 Lrp/AsnC family transcriptional regulator [Sphingomonas sp. HITSZ_GF]